MCRCEPLVSSSGASPCDGLGGFLGQHGGIVQNGRGRAQLRQTGQHHCEHQPEPLSEP